MNSKPITIDGVTLTLAAAQNVEETGADVSVSRGAARRMLAAGVDVVAAGVEVM